MSRIIPLIVLAALIAVPASAQTPLERYLAADLSINNGDGYKTYTNETATLAWGESYIMMSYISAYLGTADTFFLDKLADHADHVLANRDDARGVTDFRGVSGACWRNLHYQPDDEPYCYSVHSGMITHPLAAFAQVVRDDPALWAETTYDGATYLEKAEAYVTACYETIAYHEDQWIDDGDAGYYVFRPDATFLGYPGVDLPLNQGNALGRTIVTLAQSENDALLFERAGRMARWLDDQLLHAPLADCYLWNYWGGTYSSPGEDISHAAINADFAALCSEAGVVFDDIDNRRFARTFSKRVYESSEKLYDHVGGTGSYNGYNTAAGRWLRVSPLDPTVYCATRNQYDAMNPGGGGSVVLGFANVFRYDLPEEETWHFTIDGWEDMGDYRVPVSSEAGIYFQVGKSINSKLSITYESYTTVEIGQIIDGDEETVARFGLSGGSPRTLFLGASAVEDAGDLGYGHHFLIHNADRVYEGTTEPEPPVITTEPTITVTFGEQYTYPAGAIGTMPIHFTAVLDGRPVAIDLLTGLFERTFLALGDHDLVIIARNTAGRDEQAFTLTVEAGACYITTIAGD